MKHFFYSPIGVILPILALTSCSSVEDMALQPSYISQLNDTGCLSNNDFLQSRSDYNFGSFEMEFNGSTAKCKFTSLLYPCDFGRVNVNVISGEGMLTIVEYPSSDKANCLCEVNASFLIENIPQQDFILTIYHACPNGAYNPDQPMYQGLVSLSQGKVTIGY